MGLHSHRLLPKPWLSLLSLLYATAVGLIDVNSNAASGPIA